MATGVGIGLLGLVAGLAAALVPRGLPYDEPSHWDNVLYIANHWALPIIGQPNVSYEAQQAPFIYIVDALVYHIFGEGLAGFYAVRLTGCLWLAACCLLSYALIRSSWPGLHREVTLLGVALAFANPMVIGVAMSVQNDIPSVALALAALYLALARRSAHVVGIITAFAVLTKFTTWPVAVALLYWYVSRGQRRQPVVFLSTVIAGSGWWVVRNLVLYGDPSGSTAVHRLGIYWSPIGIHFPGTAAKLLRSAVTFLWLPVEYYRNLAHAPVIVTALVLVSSTAIAAGSIAVHNHRLTSSGRLVLSVGTLVVLQWVVVDTCVEGASFRLAYLALPVWAAAAAMGLSRLSARLAALAVGALLLGLNVWCLVAVNGVAWSAGVQ